mgnify:CR=1 FL=1
MRKGVIPVDMETELFHNALAGEQRMVIVVKENDNRESY